MVAQQNHLQCLTMYNKNLFILLQFSLTNYKEDLNIDWYYEKAKIPNEKCGSSLKYRVRHKLKNQNFLI